jgi:hypothetical protein
MTSLRLAPISYPIFHRIVATGFFDANKAIARVGKLDPQLE